MTKLNETLSGFVRNNDDDDDNNKHCDDTALAPMKLFHRQLKLQAKRVQLNASPMRGKDPNSGADFQAASQQSRVAQFPVSSSRVWPLEFSFANPAKFSSLRPKPTLAS